MHLSAHSVICLQLQPLSEDYDSEDSVSVPMEPTQLTTGVSTEAANPTTAATSTCPSGQENQDEDAAVAAIFKDIALFILLLQSRFNLSGASITALITFLSTMLKQTGKLAANQLKDLIQRFPRTISALKKNLRTTAKYATKAACPKCDRLFDEENV